MKSKWMIAWAIMVLLTPLVSAETKKPGGPAANAAAADDEDHESRVDRKVETMTAELKLSKSQQAEIRKLLEAHKENLKAFRKEMSEKRKKLRDDIDAKVLAVLKGDQKAKWQERRASGRDGERDGDDEK